MAKKKYEELSQEAKEARRKYHREWTAKNPDKVKEITHRYWERKAAQEAQKEGA